MEKEDHENAICPGFRVGSYLLGISQSELISTLPSGYTLVDAADCIIYQTEVIKFFIARKNNILDGIYVYHGFQGKYLNKFGVGSTVQELKDYFRDKLVYDEMDNSYSIVDVPGIDFSRDRTYNDQEAIIKGISVF